VAGGGLVESIADLASYESSNNPDGGALDSNPYGLVVTPGGEFLVTDGAGNDALIATVGSTISTLTVLPAQPNPLPFGPPVYESVPTAVAVGPDGDRYVGEFTGFPFPPGGANVYRVDAPSGNRSIAHSAFTNIIDLTFDANGNLYVLQFTTNGLASDIGPGPGALIKIDATTGDRTTIASDGLMFPTSVLAGENGTLYVSNQGTFAGIGQVLRLTPVPEPTSPMLFAAGLFAAAVRRTSTPRRRG
jgi:hypothetical protein